MFENNHVEHMDKNFFEFLKMRLFGDEEWADPANQAHLVPTTSINQSMLDNPGQALQVSWLGHSTFLIQYQGLNILTDPVFSERASPVPFAGPMRYTPVAMNIDSLPAIDYVIISHNHYDHLDTESIKVLNKGARFMVPEAMGDYFQDLGVDENNIYELAWWQHEKFDGIGITATPSQHWSARSLFDRNNTHWASWALEFDDKKIWFAGDTGYNRFDFTTIGEKFNGFDLALIPIGAYAPRSFMKLYHVNVDEAIQIHRDINASLSVGMHWGTFPLTAEPVMEPKQWLERKQAELTRPFITMAIGATLIL
ncbi:MBL fold metallo-hydrolase [Thalassotalea mangrovi]|nr:MBL fold metallo-hydrolase [Thalassotalea mangrovi]